MGGHRRGLYRLIGTSAVCKGLFLDANGARSLQYA